MNEIKYGVILSYANLIFTIILGVVVSPYTIKMLGDSEYGLYTLIGAFVGYLSILDLGLNNAVIRFVAQYRDQKNTKAEENFLAIIFIIYAAIGVFVFIVGIIFYYKLDFFFQDSLTFSELSKAKVMYIILLFNFVIAIPGGVFAGICSGYEKFVYPRILTLIKLLLRTALLVYILYKGADSLGLIILDTILNVLFIIATGAYVFQKLKIRVYLHLWDFTYIKEIFNYSLWVFVFALVYQFQWRTGQVILGATTNTILVGIYGVGVMLGVYYTSFGNVIISLFLPKAVQDINKNISSKELTINWIKLGRMVIIVLMYVFGAFLLFGQDFIFLWIGKVYQDSYLITLLIMAAYIIPISQGYSHVVLEAKKLLKFKALMFLLFSFLGTSFGYFLSIEYKAKGMIYGLVLGLFLFEIIMNIYYHKVIKLNVFLFFKNVIFHFMLPFFFTLILSSFIVFQFTDVSWFNFIFKIVIYSALFIIINYFFLNKEEKNLILKF